MAELVEMVWTNDDIKLVKMWIEHELEGKEIARTINWTNVELLDALLAVDAVLEGASITEVSKNHSFEEEHLRRVVECKRLTVTHINKEREFNEQWSALLKADSAS